MKIKWNFLLCFFIVAGIVLGALLAKVCEGVPFLSWLAYSQTIGFNSDAPFVLDLSVLRLTFGFTFRLSVAQIFTIGAAIFVYNHTRLR